MFLSQMANSKLKFPDNSFFLTYKGSDFMDEQVTVDVKKQKTCKHKNTVVINYSPIWHDGDVVCEDCGKYIRSFDAG